MNSDQIKFAKKFGNNYVAEGDMVEVVHSFIADPTVYRALGSNSKFIARVVCLSEDRVKFDLSAAFNSNIQTISNSHIISIAILPKGEDS